LPLAQRKDHTTNVIVDYDFFNREKVPLRRFQMVDGESNTQRRHREQKEAEAREEEEERKKEEEEAKAAEVRRAELGEEQDELTEEEKKKKADKELELELKRKQRSRRKTRKLQQANDNAGLEWDDTPHKYWLNEIPHVEEIAPATPHSRHEFRRAQAKNYPPPGRCGTCIGCMTLTRCKQQGAYARIDEAVELINGGLLERQGEGSLQEALAVIRARREAAGVEKKSVAKKEVGGRPALRRRQSISFGRKGSSAGLAGM
jgi:hypothetical protein